MKRLTVKYSIAQVMILTVFVALQSQSAAALLVGWLLTFFVLTGAATLIVFDSFWRGSRAQRTIQWFENLILFCLLNFVVLCFLFAIRYRSAF